MSMHEIEGLTESSTYLINESKLSQAEKRDLLVNVYQKNAGFDVGYTHFRCIDILLNYGHTYKIPIDQHPDFDLQKDYFSKLDDYWVPANFSDEDKGSVYLNERDNHLYFDAGDDFWKRLTNLGQNFGETPEIFTEEEFIYKMLQLCVNVKDFDLFSEWLALYCNEYLDYNSDSFNEFQSKTAIKNIRQLVDEYKNKLNKKAGYRSTKLPNLKGLLEYENDIEQELKYRYLLDFKTTGDKVIASYQRKQKKLQKEKDSIPAAIQIILDKMKSFEAEHQWKFANKEETENGEIKMLWYQGLDENFPNSNCRKFIELEFNPEDKVVYCFIGFQHKRILNWQNRTPENQKIYWHFYDNLQLLIPSEVSEKNKYFPKWEAGWKYSPASSKVVLEKTMDSLLEMHCNYAPEYYKMADDFNLETPNYFKRDADKLYDCFTNDEPIPEYLLFNVAVMIPLSFAFHYKEIGDMNGYKTHLNKSVEIVRERTRRKVKSYLEHILKNLIEGKEQVFPLMLHNALLLSKEWEEQLYKQHN